MHEVFRDLRAVRIMQRMSQLVVQIVDRFLVMQVFQLMSSIVQFFDGCTDVLQVGFPQTMGSQ